MVHFELRPEHCRWSVGTAEPIRCDAGAYRAINRVLLVAAVRKSRAMRVVQWDAVELALKYADGNEERIQLGALPRASSGLKTRRGVFAPTSSAGGNGGANDGRVQQYADIATRDSNVIGVAITGQVLLLANEPGGVEEVLDPDDIQGSIAVYTEGLPTNGAGA
jgi:hypothetical protein